MRKKRFITLYLVWGIVISGTYLLSLYFTFSFNKQIVKASSKAFFQEIVNTRSWNASHGGIYLVINDKLQPNPYLEDSLRDLTTTNGMKLTKVNPAYMTRQISEITRKENDVFYHITSLNPIRPLNKADEWEKKALMSFEQGSKEQFELVDQDSVKVFRYMAPLLVEQSCLTCHAKQGYTLGQIRGGISVTTPSSEYFHTLHQIIFSRSVIFAGILLIGFTGIFFFQRMVRKQFLIVESQNKKLTVMNLEKDRLFSIVGHDLRGPLSGIHGLSGILLDEFDTLNPEERIRIIGSISRSSGNVLSLSEHLIQWYQTRKGIMNYKPEDFQLVAIVEEILDLYTEKAEMKEISLTLDIPAGMKIYADLNMTGTIFRNLISNALKFTPQGGLIEIIAREIPASDHIEISVKDNGIGMDQATIDHLFDEDFHSSRPGTENEDGTGLGLAICREFITRNEGTIRVTSTPGLGSEFVVTLPKRSHG